MADIAPIDMVLPCPQCGKLHLDAPEHASDGSVKWANPPHKSHLCHHCGCIWRPADVPTNGVAKTQTRGSADTWGGDMDVMNAMARFWRRDGIERAAKVAEERHVYWKHAEHEVSCDVSACEDIAKAIRQLSAK